MTSLLGKHIVVTRAKHQAAQWARMLKECGAIPLLYPCIEIRPVQDNGIFDSATQDLSTGKFDWLVLTSQNAVDALCASFPPRRESTGSISDEIPGQARNDEVLLPPSTKLAAVGPSTAEYAEQNLGIKVHRVPKQFDAATLAESLADCRGKRVFLPQGDLARPLLAERLKQIGADVTAVTAYHTILGTGGDDVVTHLKENKVDAITFTSSSSVVNFLTRLDHEGGNRSLLEGLCIACIGHVTSETAIGKGLNVNVTSPDHTLEGLLKTLNERFAC